jgi:protein disulfide-isomerase-like protein
MKKKVFILLYLFLVAKLYNCEEESIILELTDKNFDENINKHNIILVLFFAPWCGHCQYFEPKFLEAAKTLKKQNSPTCFARVDATLNEKISERFKINGYPTVWFKFNGNWEEYLGGRESEQIVEWINQRSKIINPIEKNSLMKKKICI